MFIIQGFHNNCKQGECIISTYLWSSNTYLQSTEVGVVEEILVMILEIVNSCLSHRLATNPHLVYCLLYQREVFSPLHTSPPLMDLVRNILSVSLLLSLSFL